MNTTDLTSKCAIVTGGGTGIGRAIAVALVDRGANVVITGRRREPLEEVVGLLEGRAGKGRLAQADVSVQADVARVVSLTVELFGGADVLVNNAGIGGSGAIHEHDIATWDRVMATNLRGPFLLSRAVLPIMRSRRSGHIINISSESGLEYYQGNGAYGVSKHALNALGEYIQRENQEFGIRVDTICPGMVVTPMSDSAVNLDRTKCLYPDDIADLTLWLLTRRANVKIGRPMLIQTMQNPWNR